MNFGYTPETIWKLGANLFGNFASPLTKRRLPPSSSSGWRRKAASLVRFWTYQVLLAAASNRWGKKHHFGHPHPVPVRAFFENKLSLYWIFSQYYRSPANSAILITACDEDSRIKSAYEKVAVDF